MQRRSAADVAAAQRTRLDSLEIARECVELGARTRTISLLTGLPPSVVVRHVFGRSHSSVVGRPPYAEEFIFRAKVAVQAEIGVFARAYRRLRDEGFGAGRALIAAYRHHANVFVPTSICFDEAFFLVSCLDGIWGSPRQTLELYSCRTCSSPHVLPVGPGASDQCALCKVSSKPHLYAMARPREAAIPVRPVPAELDRTIAALRLQQAMGRHGADPRIVRAVVSLRRVQGDRRAKRTQPPRCGRPLPLARWGSAVKAVQRVMYASGALAFRDLIEAGFGPAEALEGAYAQVSARFGKDLAPSFDRCFEVISLLEARWGVTTPKLGLVECEACGSHHLVSLVDEISASCPVCEVLRRPELYVSSRGGKSLSPGSRKSQHRRAP